MGASEDRIRRAAEMEARDPEGVQKISETVWRVRSSTRHGWYQVERRGDEWTCNCDDQGSDESAEPCKHCYRVYRTLVPSAKLVPTPGEPLGKTHSKQNEAAYNRAQMHEMEQVYPILRALCNTIPEPERDPTKAGRPPILLADRTFEAIQKVYHQWSMRRNYGHLASAALGGYIATLPLSFEGPSRFFLDTASTPILERLLAYSAVPLAALEKTVAIDSSGFRIDSYGFYNAEHYRPTRHHEWVKLNIAVGVATHVVAAAIVSPPHDNDTLFFQPLLERAYKTGFRPDEVCADKGYLSRKNADAAAAIGAIPYIPMKQGLTGQSRGSAPYRRLCLDFVDNRAHFDGRYHQRSNVEVTFMAIKKKLGEPLRSRTFVSQQNELLAKVIAYNLTVLVHERFERGHTLEQSVPNGYATEFGLSGSTKEASASEEA